MAKKTYIRFVGPAREHGIPYAKAAEKGFMSPDHEFLKQLEQAFNSPTVTVHYNSDESQLFTLMKKYQRTNDTKTGGVSVTTAVKARAPTFDISTKNPKFVEFSQKVLRAIPQNEWIAVERVMYQGEFETVVLTVVPVEAASAALIWGKTLVPPTYDRNKDDVPRAPDTINLYFPAEKCKILTDGKKSASSISGKIGKADASIPIKEISGNNFTDDKGNKFFIEESGANGGLTVYTKSMRACADCGKVPDELYVADVPELGMRMVQAGDYAGLAKKGGLSHAMHQVECAGQGAMVHGSSVTFYVFSPLLNAFTTSDGVICAPTATGKSTLSRSEMVNGVPSKMQIQDDFVFFAPGDNSKNTFGEHLKPLRVVGSETGYYFICFKAGENDEFYKFMFQKGAVFENVPVKNGVPDFADPKPMGTNNMRYTGIRHEINPLVPRSLDNPKADFFTIINQNDLDYPVIKYDSLDVFLGDFATITKFVKPAETTDKTKWFTPTIEPAANPFFHTNSKDTDSREIGAAATTATETMCRRFARHIMMMREALTGTGISLFALNTGGLKVKNDAHGNPLVDASLTFSFEKKFGPQHSSFLLKAAAAGAIIWKPHPWRKGVSVPARVYGVESIGVNDLKEIDPLTYFKEEEIVKKIIQQTEAKLAVYKKFEPNLSEETRKAYHDSFSIAPSKENPHLHRHPAFDRSKRQAEIEKEVAADRCIDEAIHLAKEAGYTVDVALVFGARCLRIAELKLDIPVRKIQEWGKLNSIEELIRKAKSS
ncbi:Uncharacterised protein [Candidatus Gugararchaeum adminiculabundum]|nr:Uncharacterised protein [Candidatus Gugararchaeum adminiculabundum]